MPWQIPVWTYLTDLPSFGLRVFPGASSSGFLVSFAVVRHPRSHMGHWQRFPHGSSKCGQPAVVQTIVLLTAAGWALYELSSLA